MDVRQLKYFLACARRGSLTLAAEELYTTQPHVSMVIKSLEKELGVSLFFRKSKGVELTSEGERIYSYAANAIKNTELITAISQEKIYPLLRVASNPSSHMAVLLTHYYQLKKEQNLLLQYTECGIEEMITLVSQGTSDIGFLMVPEDRNSALSYMLERRHLKFTPLLTTDLVLYAGKNHPLYNAEFITPQQLTELQFIQLDDDFFSVEDILKKLPQFHTLKDTLHQTVRTNSNHMMIQMLQHTDLCNIGSYWLRDMYRQYDFGRIPIKNFEQKISFGYLKHSGSAPDSEAEQFIDFLIHAIQIDADNS
ncbi:LysR family transcriptional regulator [Ruminococcus sp. OA3]|uniref:LysR family transcriptional regulator n=1 Tax=Ruminococcus sp. OA3 TaxID=2914164 RepID=UPI001F058DBF|nr:LysR family transcriptional regulator [Ruminococcus sp. OA3]MCH1984075.1 LysR family transcriptional regulator [Ruminococcus sp. OA3]